MKPKRTLVTGATRGVGEALTLRLVSKGHVVFALARTRDQLDSLVERGGVGKVIPFEVDISNRRQVEETIALIDNEHDGVDVLVNNAGVVENVFFEEQDLDMVDRIIDVNLKGALYVTRCVVPLMVRSGGGRIINVSSGAGTRATASLDDADRASLDAATDVHSLQAAILRLAQAAAAGRRLTEAAAAASEARAASIACRL